MIAPELEALIVRMAQEHRSWGYNRIVSALVNLGLTVSAQTVGNVLKRHGIAPAPERKTTTTWKECIRTHMDVLAATDFFTAEVWTLGGLVTYYIVFFIHLGSRQVPIAGIMPHPNAAWMGHIARNATMEAWGVLSPGPYLIHDRDGQYCPLCSRSSTRLGGTRVPLSPWSPNLHASAERWIRSVREECLSRLILFGISCTALVERRTQRFEHAFEAVQRTDSSQHMGGSGPLSAPPLQPPTGFTRRKQGVEEPLGTIMRE